MLIYLKGTVFQVDEQLSHLKFDACEVKYETRDYLLQGFKLQMSGEENKLDCTVCINRGTHKVLQGFLQSYWDYDSRVVPWIVSGN